MAHFYNVGAFVLPNHDFRGIVIFGFLLSVRVQVIKHPATELAIMNEFALHAFGSSLITCNFG